MTFWSRFIGLFEAWEVRFLWGLRVFSLPAQRLLLERFATWLGGFFQLICLGVQLTEFSQFATGQSTELFCSSKLHCSRRRPVGNATGQLSIGFGAALSQKTKSQPGSMSQPWTYSNKSFTWPKEDLAKLHRPAKACSSSWEAATHCYRQCGQM